MGRIKKKKGKSGLRNCVGSPKCSVNKKSSVQRLDFALMCRAKGKLGLELLLTFGVMPHQCLFFFSALGPKHQNTMMEWITLRSICTNRSSSANGSLMPSLQGGPGNTITCSILFFRVILGHAFRAHLLTSACPPFSKCLSCLCLAL